MWQICVNTFSDIPCNDPQLIISYGQSCATLITLLRFCLKIKISRIVVVMHPNEYCDVDNDWQIEMLLFIKFRDDYLR